MMNEFPGHYRRVWDEVDAEGVVGMNGTEYLERLEAAGFSEKDFEPIQPLHQHAIWQRVGGSPMPERVAEAIEDAKRADHRFHMEGSSWTSDRSWVRGYDDPRSDESPERAVPRSNRPPRDQGEPRVSERPPASTGHADELLPLLGIRAVDRYGAGALPARKRDSHARLLSESLAECFAVSDRVGISSEHAVL
jgi:hypothetical protein